MLPIWSAETERLRIRPFALDDLDAIAPIIDEGFGAVSRAEREEWLRWQVMNYTALARLYQPPYGDRAVILKATGALIGAVGIVPSYGPFEKLPHWKNALVGTRYSASAATFSTPEIGLYWLVASSYRGHGYAAEAAQATIRYLFDEWKLKRIVATTEYDNASSIAVMRRLGLTIERNPDDTPAWFQIVGVLENTMSSEATTG
jgi:[ribosomal protein S5]-alanine N-acetyltransferase